MNSLARALDTTVRRALLSTSGENARALSADLATALLAGLYVGARKRSHVSKFWKCWKKAFLGRWRPFYGLSMVRLRRMYLGRGGATAAGVLAHVGGRGRNGLVVTLANVVPETLAVNEHFFFFSNLNSYAIPCSDTTRLSAAFVVGADGRHYGTQILRLIRKPTRIHRLCFSLQSTRPSFAALLFDFVLTAES